MKRLAPILLFSTVMLPSLAQAQTELKNDGFTDMGSVGFQAGFAAGEIGASRFILPASAPRPSHLRSVKFLFGGRAGTQTITLRIYDDRDGTAAPGAELFTSDYMVTASDNSMQEIDLRADTIMLPGNFRVGIEFQHAGLPSIARDDDGDVQAGRNFIKEATFGWLDSRTLGLTGDWIIRAVIASDADAGTPVMMPDSGTPVMMPDSGTPVTTMDASMPMTGADASSTGGPVTGGCQVNSDCTAGSYCSDTTGRCTFDCRADDDCGSGEQCNSLGRCVTAQGGGSSGVPAQGCGCGSNSAGTPMVPQVAIAIAVLALLRRRRTA